MHGVPLVTFAAEDDQENCDENCAHVEEIFAAQAFSKKHDSEETRKDGFKTADNAHRGNIKVVYTTEGDIDGEATLQAAED